MKVKQNEDFLFLILYIDKLFIFIRKKNKFQTHFAFLKKKINFSKNVFRIKNHKKRFDFIVTPLPMIIVVRYFLIRLFRRKKYIKLHEKKSLKVEDQKTILREKIELKLKGNLSAKIVCSVLRLNKRMNESLIKSYSVETFLSGLSLQKSIKKNLEKEFKSKTLFKRVNDYSFLLTIFQGKNKRLKNSISAR